MKTKKTPKPKTKATLPKNEHTIVDVLPASARNTFYQIKNRK